MRRSPLFSTEAEMCTAFSDWARKQGWTPYPETAGWDLLLVGADGTQIGVQAKLQLNVKVLDQAIEDSYAAWKKRGPDFRAVLLPRDFGCDAVCGALGLAVFKAYQTGHREPGHIGFYPNIVSSRAWHYWNPERREELPAYVPDVQPGASGPVQLTDWKIRALRLAAVLDIRGYITRADFRAHQVDPRRWTGWHPEGREWLLAGAEPGQYVKGPGLRFAEQHPVVFAQIRAEVAAEMELTP